MQYKSIIRETLLTYLEDFVLRKSATVFVHRRGLRTVRCSYTDLVSYAYQTACELKTRGIQKGDRVILCGDNSAEWAAVFWGCLMRGAVVVPLDKDSTSRFARSVQQQTDARLVFASEGAKGVSELEVPQINLDDLIEVVSSHRLRDWRTALDHSANSDSLVEIIFTSGTTSAPKGVMLTHRNLLANLLPIEAEIAKYSKWERFVHPVRFLNLVPLSHVFGQFMGLFVAQLLGAEVHFHNNLNPAEIVEHTRKHRISLIVLVPRVLDSLRHWIERQYAALGKSEKLKQQMTAAVTVKVWRRWWTFRRVHRLLGWKFWGFVSGGATLEEQTQNFWQRLGLVVLQGYGMTETASLVSVTHPFKNGTRSIGKLMPGSELKLGDDGEIIVRGPSVSSGYWGSSDRTFRPDGEWFHTGDVGTIDAHGHLQFRGRKKEVIVTSAGLNIYPEDLEEVVNQQPEVQLSCVIKWSGPQGDEPMAVLILKDPDAKAEEIIEQTNQKLPEYQRIRRWRVWETSDFPRTASQKILRREVAAKITAGIGQDVGPHEGVVPNFILSEAARISGELSMASDQPSLKLGTDLKLDSLGRIELLSALEDRYQIEIDEAAFTDATTVGDVEQIVRGEIKETSTPYPYPTWSHKLPFTAVRALLFYAIIVPVTRVMSRMRVEGLDHLKNLSEPVLFISNHVTLGDHALILNALPVRLRHRLATAMEGERLRGWLHPPADTSFFMRVRLAIQYVLVTMFFHVFPLPKKSGFRRSFTFAAECVERGFSLLVFPEGLRAPRGQMHMSKFKPGIGLLATELGIPVVPVKLRGLYELKRRRQYFAAKGMVSVSFGRPIKIDRTLSSVAIADELQRQLESI